MHARKGRTGGGPVGSPTSKHASVPRAREERARREADGVAAVVAHGDREAGGGAGGPGGRGAGGGAGEHRILL